MLDTIGLVGCLGIVSLAVGIVIAYLLSLAFPEIGFCWLALIAWLGPYAIILLIIGIGRLLFE